MPRVSCQGITKSAVFSRLLTQTKEAHKKINRAVRVTNSQKDILEKDDSELQFPYVVQAQYKHRTAADTHLQYHCYM